GPGQATHTPGAVARLEATQVPAFRQLRDSQGPLEGADPILPPGWQCEVWQKDSEGEFRSETVAGRPALRVCATKGTNAAQFVFRPFKIANTPVTPDRSYRVRIEYQADPGLDGYVHFQTREDYGWLGQVPLKNQGPGWHTATGIVRPNGKDFQVAIGSTRAAPGKFVSISLVELIPESPLPEKTAETVIYKLDLSKTKPFVQSNKGRTIENPQPPADAPSGWNTHSWIADCTHEFIAEKRGEWMALGIRLTTGPNTGRSEAMLYAGGIGVVPNRDYTLRITYQANGQFADADIRIREEQTKRLRIVGQKRLTTTNGEWATLTVPYKNGNTDKIQLEFHHYGPLGNGNELFLCEVELIDTQVIVANPGRSIFSLDLSTVAPFQFTYQDGAPSEPDWRSKVPAGIFLHCWKKESVSLFRAEEFEGRPALGITNLNDDISSQMLIQFDDGLNVPTVAGKEYRVRLEYCTTNEAAGRMVVRNPKGGEFGSIAETPLANTNGQWKWVETTFRRPADGKIDVCIINTTVGEGNTLYFRGLEVIELSPGKN
ncbi:MAG: hypothetical protein L0241_13825, partial [Planctomycetia bacterium]|nr:hypothetical protein [Planctomycetia bacterium]